MATTKRKSTHALFWTLLKGIPGYREEFKEVIKEGVVHQYSGGQTSSLSEMYRKYPEAYSRMIEHMKGTHQQRQSRYDEKRDLAAKRVIAAICSWVDKMGYQIHGGRDGKLHYAKAIACRAANCSDFNSIPESRLVAIYNLYCRKNQVIDQRSPLTEYVICKN